MNRSSNTSGVMAMLAILLTAWNLCAAESIITPAMVGHWEGNARIIVSWCHQTNLPVTVDIHADGSVTGKIGDATLVRGRFESNRGWLGRKLNLASDYIIRGKLDGSIVAAEGITRDGVSIPLNFNESRFTGGVHTSGAKFGGREKMVLSAMSLTLARSK